MITKNLSFTLIAICIGAMTLSSCKKKGCIDPTATNYNENAKKDDGSCTYAEPVPDPVPSIPFTAKVDGVEFIEDNLNASVSSWSQTLTIEGTKTNGQYVRIKCPASITPGTYTFQDPDLGTFAAYYDDGNSPYGAANGTGTLKIVSHNTSTNKITGFFNFTASQYSFSSGNDSYVISSGEFVVTY